jgi:hypothetical protein
MHKEMGTYHLLALQQPVGPEFTSANSASVGRHSVAFVTAMWVTARNTILKNGECVDRFCSSSDARHSSGFALRP